MLCATAWIGYVVPALPSGRFFLYPCVSLAIMPIQTTAMVEYDRKDHRMKATILPPVGCRPDEVKHEIKMLNNGYVVITTYPNGIEMVVTYMNGHANVETSKPLIKINENTYQIPD